MPRETQTPAALPGSAPVKLSLHHHPVFRKALHLTRTLHTYLSMLALVLFGFFSMTGFMLNHEELFGLDFSRRTSAQTTIPLDVLQPRDKLALVEYLRAHCAVRGAVQNFEFADAATGEPLHLVFKAPGSQTEIDISLADGKGTLAIETRGLTALLTNLHRGKDTGPTWRLIIDGTSILLAFAALSGFFLWYSLPKRRVIGLVALACALALVLGIYFVMVP